MNKFIFSALLLSAVTANAQVKNGMVGINTDEPRATMHIEPGVSESKGLIIPRITAAQMKTMTGLAHFGADHHAIITYLKEDLPSADQTGKLAEVKEAGYYFYNHTAGKWQKFGGGGEQDFKVISSLYGRNNYLTKDAGVGGNGTSVGTGEGNIAIGTNAFYYNTTGASNIAQGLYALHQNTTGNNNIAQGEGALYSNNIGYNNIAQGYQALFYNTTGANNIAIGESALKGQTIATPMTGNYNIALGANALQNTTSGEHNIAQGFQALKANTTGNNNIAQGNAALYSNTTGISNIAQGQEALYSNTTGKFNIAQGNGALKANTTGDFNIAQGYQALHSNTTGGGNVAQGNSVLRNNTTGENNVAQGLSALYNNTTGSFNVAQGFQALFYNTTGANNIAQGNLALFNNTSGKNNIALGENALKGQILATPITGDGNIALGKNTLQNTTSGSENIALGTDALYSNTAGRNNIAQGQNALYSNTTGFNNVALGRDALYNNTSGENNIAQGNQALAYNTTGNNNIAQGSQALFSNNLGNNNIALGRGTLSTNVAGSYNTAMGVSSGKWIKGNANIHIGLDTDEVIPNASGELNNVIAIGHFDSTGGFPLNTTTANDNVILLGNTSPTAPKVGIGTYKPGAKLEVNNGTAAGAVKIVDGTQGAGKVLTSDADGLATWKSITLFTGTERIGAYHWGVGTALGNTNFNKIASITVPPGASMVYVKIHLLAGGLTSGAARAYVGKKDIGWNNSNTNDTPIGGSALFVTYHGIDPELQTSFIYNNTTNSNETLYLNLQSNEPTVARSGFEYPTGGSYLGTNWVENQFSAIPIN